MKAGKFLLQALVVAATAYGDDDIPLVFFAKTKDAFVPLSVREFHKMWYFSFQNRTASPEEFFWQDGYVLTRNREPKQYAGFYAESFAVGGDLVKEKFEFDDKMMVISETFHACSHPDGPEDIILRADITPVYCESLDLYLLPYNISTGASVSPGPEFLGKKNTANTQEQVGSIPNADQVPAPKLSGKNKTENTQEEVGSIPNTDQAPITDRKRDPAYSHGLDHGHGSTDSGTGSQEEDVHDSNFVHYFRNLNWTNNDEGDDSDRNENGGRVPESPPPAPHQPSGSPMVFFIRYKGKLMPLVNGPPETSALLAYLNSSATPVEFNLKDGYAHSLDPNDNQMAGFWLNYFACGFPLVPEKFEFDDDLKITNVKFYACNSPDGPHDVILNNPKDREYCHLSDMYLLPYDRATRRPVKSLQALHPVEDAPEVVHNFKSALTFVFCTKLNGKYRPLSARNFFSFYYFTSISNNPPSEFILNNGLVIEAKVNSTLAVGFWGDIFAYGSLLRTRFQLSLELKVANHDFYRCQSKSDTHDIFTSQMRSRSDCEKVDIYLMPWDGFWKRLI